MEAEMEAAGGVPQWVQDRQHLEQQESALMQELVELAQQVESSAAVEQELVQRLQEEQDRKREHDAAIKLLQDELASAGRRQDTEASSQLLAGRLPTWSTRRSLLVDSRATSGDLFEVQSVHSAPCSPNNRSDCFHAEEPHRNSAPNMHRRPTAVERLLDDRGATELELLQRIFEAEARLQSAEAWEATESVTNDMLVRPVPTQSSAASSGARRVRSRAASAGSEAASAPDAGAAVAEEKRRRVQAMFEELEQKETEQDGLCSRIEDLQAQSQKVEQEFGTVLSQIASKRNQITEVDHGVATLLEQQEHQRRAADELIELHIVGASPGIARDVAQKQEGVSLAAELDLSAEMCCDTSAGDGNCGPARPEEEVSVEVSGSWQEPRTNYDVLLCDVEALSRQIERVHDDLKGRVLKASSFLPAPGTEAAAGNADQGGGGSASLGGLYRQKVRLTVKLEEAMQVVNSAGGAAAGSRQRAATDGDAAGGGCMADVHELTERKRRLMETKEELRGVAEALLRELEERKHLTWWEIWYDHFSEMMCCVAADAQAADGQVFEAVADGAMSPQVAAAAVALRRIETELRSREVPAAC